MEQNTDVTTQNQNSAATANQKIPAPQTPTQPKNPRKRNLLIALLVVLLLGGAAAAVWYFTEEDSKPVQQTQQTVVAKKSFYVVGDVKDSQDLFLFDAEAKTKTKVMDLENKTLLGIVNVNGIERRFFTSYSDANSRSSTNLYYQDDEAAAKKLYGVSYSTDGDGVDPIFFTGGPIANNGGYIDIWEYSNDREETVKRVSVDGAVKTIATLPKKKITGMEGSLLMLVGESADGNILYLGDYTCTQCDGPPYPNLFSYDLAMKKYSLLFAVPTKDIGDWQKINDSSYWATTYGSGGFGPFYYSDAVKEKRYIYSYDVSSGASRLIFETTGQDYQATILGKSEDGQTVYVEVEDLLKSGQSPNVAGERKGAGVKYKALEIRSYNVATGDYEVLPVPANLLKRGVLSIDSSQDRLVLTVQKPNVDRYGNSGTDVYVADASFSTGSLDKLGYFFTSAQFESFGLE